MALVKAKCPDCNGTIEVDNEKKLGICKYCGNPFMVEEAVNNYITNNITINQDDLNKFWVIEEDTLVKYNGSKRKITVPETVKEIGKNAISGKSEEVILPKTVEYIAIDGVKAKKVIIENPNIELAEEEYNKPITANEVVIPKDFKGKLTVLKSCETIRYLGTEKEFSEKFPNAYKDFNPYDMPLIVFGNEQVVIFNKSAYIVDENGNAIVLRYNEKLNFSFANTILDYRTINGVTISAFRGYGERTFNASIRSEKFYTKMAYIYLPEGLKTLGGTYSGGSPTIYCSKLYLPKSLEVWDISVAGYNEVIVPEGINLKQVKENAIMKYSKEHDYTLINLKKKGVDIHPSVAKYFVGATTEKKEENEVKEKAIYLVELNVDAPNCYLRLIDKNGKTIKDIPLKYGMNALNEEKAYLSSVYVNHLYVGEAIESGRVKADVEKSLKGYALEESKKLTFSYVNVVKKKLFGGYTVKVKVKW